MSEVKGEAIIEKTIRCVLLADRHHGLTEGVRGLLDTLFEAVVMVADDISLTGSDGLGLIRKLRGEFPDLNLIVLSVHDE